MKLLKLSKEYKKQFEDMMEEWVSYNNEHPEVDKSPFAVFKNDYRDFDNYLNNLEISNPKGNLVPDSTYFLYDEDNNTMIGAVNIRHYLNDGLLKYGGHIGDGIRPSQRRKGYATVMIKLALQECKKLGIKKVLMTCNKTNIGSAKSIINNKGILENEVIDEHGEILQRYWIDISNA
ncbi:MAG: GNAT family N-acetyltransferase [Erysipelotrichaceae bacterium]|nr:GNAT family N-acetyltransferase [Erysipelotrichaceae bacterium]